MSDTFDKYTNEITLKFSKTQTSEYGYRTDFENFLKLIFHNVKSLNIDHDPKAREGNKPDFIINSGEIPILYIETKDAGASLDKIEKSEQIDRYFGYANLVLTDYLEFRFFRNGKKYCEPIKIGEYKKDSKTVKPFPENYEFLRKTLEDFPKSFKEPIRSGKHLSKIMGGKARRIRDNIRQFYSIEEDQNSDLIKLYKTLKKLLVHDLTIKSFSDMYAQTLVYGLFVARYHDKSLSDFSRREARELIPNSNPLLRHFFDHIVGADFDKRLKYIVDELCLVFSHTNIRQLMKEYFSDNLWQQKQKGPDPVIHFYEDFLEEYDPILRKKMGAYYTPLPVVNFIVNSVDSILKKEFGLINGLADTTKTKDGLHKVQVLDPATGTGTFISGVIGKIYKEHFIDRNQKGRWPSYVHNELLPRIFGFELMMAPYTIAHLRLGIAFRKTGFWDFHRRLGVYLTNSLEESSRQTELFAFGLAESIAEESKEASVIKKEKPIMVVLGNPPYSVSSSNVTDFAQKLIEPYKQGLLLRNSQPLSDDYIKFIRLAETLIDRNRFGIVAYISNRSYLDGIIHKAMRESLLNSFDDIYILDLNGDATANQGRKNQDDDQNVFDIKQGVAISIFVKKTNSHTRASVKYFSLRGTRSYKYNFLRDSSLENIGFSKVDINDRYNFFVKKNLKDMEYLTFPSLDEIFDVHSSAIATSDDANLVSFHKDEEHRMPFSYRPFDTRYVNYDIKKVKGNRYGGLVRFLIDSKFETVFKNINLACSKNITTEEFSSVLVSRFLPERKYCDYSRGPHVFPLYLYSENTKRANINQRVLSNFKKIVGSINPEDVLDYIYAILYSTKYRKKYKEFLKIDFPRIPYPKSKAYFKNLAKLGKELRTFHLFESSKLNRFITTYGNTGNDTIEVKPEFNKGKVYINNEQYFGNIPEAAWNFWIGGYQPAQKWLKDRRGKTLTNEDIEHYQKMIITLVETDKIMRAIDENVIV